MALDEREGPVGLGQGGPRRVAEPGLPLALADLDRSLDGEDMQYCGGLFQDLPSRECLQTLLAAVP